MAFEFIEAANIGSVTQYARHRGVAQSMVSQYIRSGRLHDSVRKIGKDRYEIDFDLADKEWDAQIANSRGTEVKGPTYAQSRAIREAYQAQLSKLDFQERSGQLLLAADVRREAFMQGRRIRDTILAIPDRYAAVLAAETDEVKIKQFLERELRKLMGDFIGDETERAA